MYELQKIEMGVKKIALHVFNLIFRIIKKIRTLSQLGAEKIAFLYFYKIFIEYMLIYERNVHSKKL